VPAVTPNPSVSAKPVDTAAVTIRRLAPTDAINEITRLLHRAYRPQVEMGLAPLAGRQTDDVTADRAAHSECWIAAIPREKNALIPGTDEPVPPGWGPERIAGVILFEEVEKVTFPPFFLKPHVAHFAQFGVDPDLQGLGIGRLLLDKVEQRAREIGALELACSMAEPDRRLFDYYARRGFRFIEHWQWPYTNYRSCIISKRLA
jgi:GNAT superfamily N-acetyltransferase